MVIAPTGSGKTEAAVLPAMKRILSKTGTAHSGIKMIYITPLRALNRDMIKRLEWLCREAGLTVSVRHGDTTQSERRKQAKLAPNVLITTPETLQSILPTKSFAPHLKSVEYVVVDEVHELYSNKRGAQLSIGLERLEELSPGFKRIGISATVADPGMTGMFLCGSRKFEIALVKPEKRTELRIELPAGHTAHVGELSSKFELDDKAMARLSEIAESVKGSKSTLLFANTRQVVEALGSRLVQLNKMHDFGGVGVHHGSLDRKERIEMEDKFKSGELKCIIATSSLELGIDIGHIDLVIQYGSPRQALRMAQRIGRSGHTEAGISKGLVIATSEIDALESEAIYENMKANEIESMPICTNALDVLCNQVCGIALDKGTVVVAELLEILKRAYPYSATGRADIEGLLAFMGKQRLIGYNGKDITASQKTRMYYYEHLSVIPDSKRFVVKNSTDNRVISSLDERFVAANMEEGSVFIVKGLPWKIISIDEGSVSVEPSEQLDAAIPDWTGEDIPVSRSVAARVCELIIDNARLKDSRLGKHTAELVCGFAKKQAGFYLSSNNALVEPVEDYLIFHTGLGTLANEALARLLAKKAVVLMGKSISIRSSPYFIMLEGAKGVDIPQLLSSINVGNIEKEVEGAIAETDLFRYKFINVAKLFGVIDKGASISKSIAKRIIKVLSESPPYKETMRDILNGLDMATLAGFLSGIKSGDIKISYSDSPEISPLADQILNSAYYTRELIMPALPSRAILDSFSDFLMKKNIRLLCTYCGFHFSRKIRELKDSKRIECPSCGSVMIARWSEAHADAVGAKLSGKTMTKERRRAYANSIKEAGLFSSYGGRAAMALATYGIGPSSAARALLMHREEESLFFRDLIDSQRQFIRTKKYWSV